MAHKVFMAIAAAVTVALTALIPASGASADPLITVSNGMKWTPTDQYEGFCSMGPVGFDNQGRMIGLTAGHCTPQPGDPAGGSVWAYNDKAAGPIGYIDYIGLGAANQNTDYMVIVFDQAKVALSSTSPNGVRVDKLPTKAKPGTFTTAKKDGAASGITSGFVCSTYPEWFNSTAGLSQGDSGSAMTDGKGAVTGINIQVDIGLCLNKSVNIKHVLNLITARGASVPGAGFTPVNN